MSDRAVAVRVIAVTTGPKMLQKEIDVTGRTGSEIQR